MAESKHTSGPWEVWNHVHVRAGGQTLVTVQGEFGDPAKSANARLIAAAPELLEALTKLTAEVEGMTAFVPAIREVMGNTNWAVLRQRAEEARAALAKAGAL